MRRVRRSNALIVGLFVILFPVYPVFGAFLYDGTRSGGVGALQDKTTIISEYTDTTATGSYISPSMTSLPNSRSSLESYTVKNGDTLASISDHFSISLDTLRWANNLSSNTVRAGQNLLIPPGNGVIYVTRRGDTLDAIARRFKTTSTKIRDANFLGDILPTGVTLYLPDAVPSFASTSNPADPDKQKPFTLKVLSTNGGGFVPGHCTYFVAKYWPVKWRGHARYWFKNAAAAGFKTGKVARTGAIVVWYGPGYNLSYGHVGIVMSVDADAGTMVVKDMNYSGLWKVTTRVEKLKNKYIIGYIYNEKK